jgi:formylglycine-generating enzyme required for sulfatase activity
VTERACCAPAGVRDPTAEPATPALAARARAGIERGMVRIEGGAFLMGSDDEDAFPDDGEGPVREVVLLPYWIDAQAVCNRDFAAFAGDTGYVTDAERFGWSFVFYALLDPADRRAARPGVVPDAPWWLAVDGASWHCPEGVGSSLGDRLDHPVVHVSWRDAAAYAAWAGKRLPTEAEWENAARGGLVRAKFPWGDELRPGGEHRCNIWQGRFPEINTGEDGFLATAPVHSFAPNGYGLYNVAGNVWEWCNDWWSATWHAQASPRTRHDPRGPPAGEAKVIRGGSYLCHASYCNRYRVAARASNNIDSSTGHTGFRCAA